LREPRRARRLVISDPKILGGDPVFRGPRVPVHMIAGLLAQGSTPAEVIEGYTRLAAEMIRSRRSTPPPIRCVAGPDGSSGATGSPCAASAGSSTPFRCHEVPDGRMPQRRPGRVAEIERILRHT
jgi:uncharacterized protein (DUF433 family)